MTFTLLCDSCGMGWFLSNPFDFTRMTEAHGKNCPGPLPPDSLTDVGGAA